MSHPGTVVLVHGYLRSGLSMAVPAWSLRRAGFHVITGSFWTLNAGLAEVSESLAALIERARQEGQLKGPLHFLTHSMGGVVVRHLLAHHIVPEASRAVMISPPNQGAQVAQLWHDWLRLPWGSFDPLTKLRPQVGEVAKLPARAPIDVGIIAGGAGHEGGILGRLPGDNDGTVRVDEMLLPGASVLQIRAQHTVIVYKTAVMRQATHFLRHGAFDEEGPGELLAGELGGSEG